MRYLLDTNMIIAWQTRRIPVVIRRVAEQRHDIGLSAIVAYELFYGAFNSARSSGNLLQVEQLGFPLLSFDEGDARAAGRLRAELKRIGTPIGPYDMLIAGQALARDLVVVTANVGEFSRVAGLRIENWLDG